MFNSNSPLWAVVVFDSHHNPPSSLFLNISYPDESFSVVQIEQQNERPNWTFATP